MTLSPGLHRDVPMEDYLALDAISSGRLGTLSKSALAYHWSLMQPQPRVETSATRLGTAVHAGLLEPERFGESYILEPDLSQFGNGTKPRSTKLYQEWWEENKSAGLILRKEERDLVVGMIASVNAHKHAARLLERTPEREVTMIWETENRLCRGRADLLGDGVLGDVKTTSNLSRFSPWTISDYSYHRQMGWYSQGLSALGRKVEHVFFVAVETSPPHDVGLFSLEPAALRCGQMECDALMAKLARCESDNRWPGMFPDIVTATITDGLIEQLGEEVA